MHLSTNQARQARVTSTRLDAGTRAIQEKTSWIIPARARMDSSSATINTRVKVMAERERERERERET